MACATLCDRSDDAAIAYQYFCAPNDARCGATAVDRTFESISQIWWLRQLATFAVLATALLIWTGDVNARLKGQSSFARSSLPSFELLASPVSSYLVVASLDRPAPGTQSGTLGELFNRPGLLGGFAAGFLGAGLLGLFFGHGLFGELSTTASVLGLVFQLALVLMLCRLIWTWWSGRNQRAFTGLSPRQLADPYLRSRHELPPGSVFTPNVESRRNGDDAAISVADEPVKQ
jgi:hypothetical protein